MTVLDTSGLVDYLIGEEAFAEVDALIRAEGTLSAPDLVVFEVVAVLRRLAVRQAIDPIRAASAVTDLGDFPLEIFPALPLRNRAWELRENLTAADAFFVSLAELLAEPLATKDRGLAFAARSLGVETIELAKGH